MAAVLCKCGCGEVVTRPNKAYVNKEHQLDHMARGEARKIAKISGDMAAASGRLREAGLKGAAVAKEQAAAWRAKRQALSQTDLPTT